MHEASLKRKGDRGFMLSLAHGKYVIFYNWSHEGQFKCQRYGVNWRDFTGDNLIMELCHVAMGRMETAMYECPNCTLEQAHKIYTCMNCGHVVEEYEPDGAQMAHNELEEGDPIMDELFIREAGDSNEA